MKEFAPNWEVLGDPFCLRDIEQGVPCSCVAGPSSHFFSSGTHAFVRGQSCRSASCRHTGGAVVRLSSPPPNPRFYSNILTVAKKNTAKRRLIHNMRWLNHHSLFRSPKFRLVNVEQLRRIIQPQDFMVLLDLSDAYLHVPIHPDSQHLLRFIFKGQHYRWITSRLEFPGPPGCSLV